MHERSIQSVDLGVMTQLFDQLSDVVFFAKDALGRYLAANQTLAQRSGFAGQEELVGKLPSELFGVDLGKGFERQDALVLSSGRSFSGRLELHVYHNGKVGWCLTSKHPIAGEGQGIMGVVGISHDIRTPNMSLAQYEEVAAIVDRVLDDLESVTTIGQIVQMTGLSQFRLNQRFQAVFGLNLGQWIIKQRIDRAQNLLAETSTPIAQIASAVGYSDQSALTRQFRLSTGLTPRKFRQVTGPRDGEAEGLRSLSEL